MSSQWYYSRDGRQQGPVSVERIEQLIAERQLTSEHLAWREGLAEWMPLEAIEQFREQLRGQLRSAPPPLPPPREEGAKVAAPPKAERSAAVRSSGSWLNRLLWTSVAVCTLVVAGLWIGLFYRRNQDVAARAAASQQQSKGKAAESKSAPTTQGDGGAASSPKDGVESVEISHPPQIPSEVEPVTKSPSAKSPAVAIPSPPAAPDVPPPPANLVLDGAAATDPKVAASEPPAEKSRPPEKASSTTSSKPSRADEASIVHQELDIYRRSSFSIQGLPLAQNVRYKILSKLDVARRQPNGTRKVVQFIEDTKLLQADGPTKAMLQRSLASLKRRQYTYKLNRRNEVVEFTGHKRDKSVLPVELAGSRGFMMTSVIDEDGWKELAQLTFFQPDERVRRGETWMRQMTHDWDPLGGWEGVTSFASKERKGPHEIFQFAHDMKYIPPAKSAAAGPIQISAATFKSDLASGTLTFDPQRGHIVHAEEKFHVAGEVQTKILETASSIKLEERQLMIVTVTDERPNGW